MAMEAATGDEDVMGMYDKAAGVYALARGVCCAWRGRIGSHSRVGVAVNNNNNRCRSDWPWWRPSYHKSPCTHSNAKWAQVYHVGRGLGRRLGLEENLQIL